MATRKSKMEITMATWKSTDGNHNIYMIYRRDRANSWMFTSSRLAEKGMIRSEDFSSYAFTIERPVYRNVRLDL